MKNRTKIVHLITMKLLKKPMSLLKKKYSWIDADKDDYAMQAGVIFYFGVLM